MNGGAGAHAKAAEHGTLETVATFLRELREDEWFHSGD